MWHNILGHDKVAEYFQRSARRNRLAGSYLFVGPSGIGKRTFALALAKSLFCQNNSTDDLDACGKCSACQQSDHGNHPDLFTVAKPPDKSSIPIDLLIGEKEKRGKSGLCYEISRKSYAGGYKIAIIDDVDDLNQEGANALLKTLEEPPPLAMLILIGTSAMKQLPTIRSRCRVIRFSPLPDKELARLLYDHAIADSQERAFRIAGESDGGLDSAKALCDDTQDEIRDALLKEMAGGVRNSVMFAMKLNEWIDSAGKEAALRRRRLRHVLVTVLDYYRHLNRIFCGIDAAKYANHNMFRYLQQGNTSYQEDPARVFHAMERTLSALEQVDRNVQISYVVDAWLLDL